MSHIGYKHRQHSDGWVFTTRDDWPKQDTHNPGYLVSKEHSDALVRAIFKTSPIRKLLHAKQ